MVNCEVRRMLKSVTVSVYCLSTLFILFFSIHAIEKWPGLWAPATISLACLLPAFLVISGNGSRLIREKWPVEIKFVLVIVVLGVLNVCFSEARGTSLKGMGLFLMSGPMIFATTFFLFSSRPAQKAFILMSTISFIALVLYGVFEFVRSLGVPENSILLFSSNPIPAGSLLILLSSGPLILLFHVQSCREKKVLWTCLLIGAVLVLLIGKRGPILALLVMLFVWGAMRSRGILVLSLIGLVLLSIGFQFRDQIPSRVYSQSLQAQTALVRLEFYRVAWQVVSDKPLFGIGFNAPMTRYISPDYDSKWYPPDAAISFPQMAAGIYTFDNMLLCLMGEAGGMFAVAYIGLLVFLFKKILRAMGMDLETKAQATMLLIVLAGFGVESLTFDSLRYPDLNWEFHSLLGLMAAYCKTTLKV